MKKAVTFIAIAALTFFANLGTATEAPTAFVGTFSWDGARGAQPNGYLWECRDGGSKHACQYD